MSIDEASPPAPSRNWWAVLQAARKLRQPRPVTVYARGGTYARAVAGAQGLAAPSSVPGFPPPLATVAAGIRAACRHGAPPGRCALCRGVEPTAERPAREPARSHAEDIRAALRARAAASAS